MTGNNDGHLFTPGHVDPNIYDRVATEYLISQYFGPIEAAIDALGEERFEFDTMQVLHKDALDVELIYRQCIPATGMALRLGVPTDEVCSYDILFTTCQTLILNHIDRHLDLSSSYSIRDPSLLLADVRSVMCYAAAQLYTGMIRGTASPTASAALSQMAQVSLIITQSMHDNYATRFREEYIDGPTILMDEYAHGVRSRHLGSGFYASSITGMYRYFALPQPDDLVRILGDMRRLRQRVDELSDLFEDTATGLLSYPVVRLLCLPTYQMAGKKAVRDVWRRSKELLPTLGGHAGHANRVLLRDPLLIETCSALTTLLKDSGVMESCYIEGDELWSSVRANISECLGSNVAEILIIVVDLKRALLERLALSGWANNPPTYTFNDMRKKIAGRTYDNE